ncbi:hypothetical protein [Mesorhizobium sp. WSM3860]|uniref:hypothetical protein n=1 Tax=Mesorhizobium sp. WSM3860 TaxID=2029403 RepID=UPI000BAECBB4|nr:hypothetical protein [Mesorhizobium sp. WSM3860]PBC01112.1 hypothetical protein CK220_27970 [Mesorhizobium sp. WSM3860]
MKIIFAGLLLALALPQAAEAKTKVPVTETKVTKAEAKCPPLDQTATGGIVSGGGTIAAPHDDPGQAYPPGLDLHF